MYFSESSEYGYRYIKGGGTKKKNDQLAEHFGSMTQSEQIFARPHIYAGAIERNERKACIYDLSKNICVYSMITTPKCLERCFLEVLSNATDNAFKSREAGIDPGDIHITMTEDTISILNYGMPLPLLPHKELCVDGNFGTVADLVFDRPGSGSNVNDEYQRNTAGVNGVGVKLTNVFSREFEVEIGDNINGVHQKILWRRNKCTKEYSVCTPPYIFRNGEWVLSDGPRYTGPNFCRVTWKQDFRKFECEHYSAGDYSLYLAFACSFSFASKQKILFNDIKVDYRDINAYASLISVESSRSRLIYSVLPNRQNLDKKETIKLVANGTLIPDLEMCMLDTPKSGYHISFTNGIYNGKGGVHTNAAYKAVLDLIKKIYKSEKSYGLSDDEIDKLTVAHLKKHATLIINFKCTNPNFDSQEKTELTSPNVKVNLSDEYLPILRKWRALEEICQGIGIKVKVKKAERIISDSFRDANMVCKNRGDCSLLICEGNSAGQYIDEFIMGLPGGYDFFAKLPLKGKPANISDITNLREMDSEKNKDRMEQFQLLATAVHLEDGVDYTTVAGRKRLKYKNIKVMVDADSDGSHILCLIINFLYRRYKTFLKAGLLTWVWTPVIRAVYKKQTIAKFYTEDAYSLWKEQNPTIKHKPMYFKGLASSSVPQARDDALSAPNVVLYFDDEAEIYINLAFNKNKGDSNIRKRWILDNKDTTNRNILDTNNVASITNVFNTRLVKYSLVTLTRALISYMDNLKLSQRQLIAYLIQESDFGRGDDTSIKLPQISSAAAKEFKYHQGDLTPTLARMCLDYAGSNNLPFLTKESMTGSRPSLGKDCGAGRYVHASFNWWFKYLIKKELYQLVPKNVVEDEPVEPKYIPFLLPMGIINGTKGISTGWACYITNYHPGDVCEWVLRYISGQQVFPMMPWYNKFTGNVSLEIKTRRIKRDVRFLTETDAKFDTVCGLTCVTEGIFEISNRRFKDVTEEIPDPENPNKKKKIVVNKEFCDVLITEVPIGVHSNNLFVQLSKRCKDASVRSKNSDTPILFFEEYEGIPTQEDLGLINRTGLSNITTVNEDGLPVEFKNIYQCMTAYCNKMAELFYDLKAKRISDLTEKTTTELMKIFIINKAISGEFVFINQPDADVHAALNSYGIPFEIYDSIKPSQFSPENRDKLQRKIKIMEADLERLNEEDHIQQWRDYLIEFKTILDKKPEYRKLSKHEYPRIYVDINALVSGEVVSPILPPNVESI